MNQWDEALKREWTDQIPPEEESDLLVTFQTGKGINHLVPVMFPPCCHKALQYLCNADIRENANVSRENKYLFPSVCLLYTSPSPRDLSTSRMPSSA